jgi:RNA polymerase sigma-70 factor (ECF subfamily)
MMTASDSSPSSELLRGDPVQPPPPAPGQGANPGHAPALADLFARHRDRLRRMVRLRLDRRLQGRVDPSDVVQEAFTAMSQRAGDCPSGPAAFVWMRNVTGETLQKIHLDYFGATVDLAGQDVSLYRGALPEANSVSLAAQLLGRLTPAAQEAEHAEKQLRLQEALNGMNPLDREILALRHFEELTNPEAAEVLGISQVEASKLFIGALKRLKDIVSSIPGFLSE